MINYSKPTLPHYDAVVIGAGLAGSVVAHELHQAGQRVLVIDKSRGTGGRASSKRLESGSCDMGATSIRLHSLAPSFSQRTPPDCSLRLRGSRAAQPLPKRPTVEAFQPQPQGQSASSMWLQTSNYTQRSSQYNLEVQSQPTDTSLIYTLVCSVRQRGCQLSTT